MITWGLCQQFSATQSLSFAALFFYLKMCEFSVYAVMKSSICNGENCDNQGLFPTCCHGESCYLHSIDKAFEISVHKHNSKSEFIKPTMNSSSETKNSKYAKLSEFGNAEVKVEVQLLITLFLRQAPVLFSMNRQT